ncbi:MAG: histidinol-phosphate transaminase [Pseudomonadota bacterium]
MIKPRSNIAAMHAFALADLSSPPGVPVVSLAQNESAFPPNPVAIEAAELALKDAPLYPDPDWADLRAAIAGTHGVDPGLILCSAGSMDLISSLIGAFAGPGDTVLSTAHAYGYFASSAQISGADYVAVPESGLTVSVDALLAGVTPTTRIVCIANPGNPTGTRIPRSEVLRLRDGLPEDVILLLDEAYAEFADDLDEKMFDLAERGNTVVTRSFSKAHALAGQRIGWGVFPPKIAEHARKLITAGGVTQASLAAAAASMRDPGYVAEIVTQTSNIKDSFRAGLLRAGLEVMQSYTNFVLIQFADVPQRERADAALRAEGIIMRPMTGYGLPHTLRATIASAKVMERTLGVMTAWKEGEP